MRTTCTSITIVMASMNATAKNEDITTKISCDRGAARKGSASQGERLSPESAAALIHAREIEKECCKGEDQKDPSNPPVWHVHIMARLRSR
jgi:hypothetical protein